mmetsp:Transcript_8135/g.12155  ORF Transcript_8135/g.12155 Transcript_8135/m.12155 type:complete len:849 (+) Transcript_8135:166-2712(+)
MRHDSKIGVIHPAARLPVLLVLVFILITSATGVASTSTSTSTHHTSIPAPAPIPLPITYSAARNIRTTHGHHAAVSHYRQLLQRSTCSNGSGSGSEPGSSSSDITAATRIAAARSSPQRHEMACPLPLDVDVDDSPGVGSGAGDDSFESGVEIEGSPGTMEDIRMFQKNLQSSEYDNTNIARLFGVLPPSSSSSSPSGSIHRNDFMKEREGNGKAKSESGAEEGSISSSSSSSNSSIPISKKQALAFARGPVYIKPICAGSQNRLPSFLQRELEWLDRDRSKGLDDNENNEGMTRNRKREGNESAESSLKCLVAMFLLGFAVPKELLSCCLIGGDETIRLLERLGMAFPCEVDPNYIVPYVHLFPLDIPVLSASSIQVAPIEVPLVLVTDCHPTILSRTTVGTGTRTGTGTGTNGKDGREEKETLEEDGAVMYIGPDSLALVQHPPLQMHLEQMMNKKKKNPSFSFNPESNSDIKDNTDIDRPIDSDSHVRILDFCTGSGIQALSTLTMLSRIDPHATAVCVDINDRALRFVKFNVLLNGLESRRVRTIKADLIKGLLIKKDEHGDRHGEDIGLLDALIYGRVNSDGNGDAIEDGNGMAPFDIILANPPFIPVPDSPTDAVGTTITEAETASKSTMKDISKRYGLFSSGGSSGEEVLQSILSLSSRLLKRPDGFLAIVSEFMNPPYDGNNAHEFESNGEGNDDSWNRELLKKMSMWWDEEPHRFVQATSSHSHSRATGRGVLFTNEFPISASTYAYRRADDEAECEVWNQHMTKTKIRCVSPGMLYVKTTETEKDIRNKSDGDDAVTSSSPDALQLSYDLVKHSKLGSIWTPYNYAACIHTRNAWRVV